MHEFPVPGNWGGLRCMEEPNWDLIISYICILGGMYREWTVTPAGRPHAACHGVSRSMSRQVYTRPMSDPYERIVKIDAVRRAESIYGGPVGRGGVIDDDRGRSNIFGLCHAPSRWPKVVQKGGQRRFASPQIGQIWGGRSG